MNQDLARLLRQSQKSPYAVGQAVALVIRTAQQAIEATGLTPADLDLFDREASRTDALMPLLDPTTWMREGSENVDESRRRGKLVRGLLELPARGDGLIGHDFTAAFGGASGLVNAYILFPTEESESP